MGQGFCFGLQHSKSFNFEIDLIYELDATQHTQVKVEVHLFFVVADYEDSNSVSICALLLHVGRPKMHSFEQLKDFYTEDAGGLGGHMQQPKRSFSLMGCW